MAKPKPSVDVQRSVAVVARESMAYRLGILQQFLDAAANRAEQDIEHVHQLRVASRRALAALDMFAPLIPPRRLRHMAKLLKQVRNCAGTARDLDVLAQRTLDRHDDKRRAAILKKRAAAQAPILAMYRRFSKGRGMQNKIAKFLQSIGTGKRAGQGQMLFRHWADHALAVAAEGFFSASSRATDQPEKLHRMRIRGKRLRYTLELIGSAYPRKKSKAIIAAVSAVQDKLGDINDHAVALARYRRWLARALYRDTALTAEVIYERDTLQQRIDEFAQWWSPQREGRLQAKILSLLAAD